MFPCNILKFRAAGSSETLVHFTRVYVVTFQTTDPSYSPPEERADIE